MGFKIDKCIMAETIVSNIERGGGKTIVQGGKAPLGSPSDLPIMDSLHAKIPLQNCNMNQETGSLSTLALYSLTPTIIPVVVSAVR